MHVSGIEITSLQRVSFADIYASHAIAFKGYPFQWTKEGLLRTTHRRGFSPALSFGAFHNNKLVSFTLNGTGTYMGLSSAYDTGTGTHESFRGQGLASRIFEFSLPVLKSAGINQYVLEVLEENTKAYSVYTKQGFVVSREFDCYRVNMSEWNLPARDLEKGIRLKTVDFAWRKEMEDMLEFELSWQNRLEAIKKAPEHFRMVGAFRDERLVGFGLVEPETGDIPLLAVTRSERRKGIGTTILKELQNLNKFETVKIVNVPSDQEGIKAFIAASGIPRIVRQLEMIRML